VINGNKPYAHQTHCTADYNIQTTRSDAGFALPDQRYELTKSKLEAASLKSDADIAAIQKEHSRAAKEYLAIAFKTKFLSV